jgi:hypothetical protein
VLNTDIGLQVQALEPRVNFQEGIAENAPALGVVVTTIIELVNRVGNI